MQDIGIMHDLLSENAGEQTVNGSKFQEEARRLSRDNINMEPYYPWQNKA